MKPKPGRKWRHPKPTRNDKKEVLVTAPVDQSPRKGGEKSPQPAQVL